MTRRAALSLLLAGCEVAFPLDDRPPIDDVTVEVRRQRVTNDEDGHAVTTTELFAPASIEVTLSNGELADTVNPSEGVFQFNTPNLDYTVVVDDPIGHLEVDGAVPHVVVALQQLGRTGLDAPPFPVEVPLPTVENATVLIHTTGVFSTVAGPSFEWGGDQHTIFGPRAVLDGDQGDRLYWNELGLVQNTHNYSTIVRAAETAVTLDPSTTNTIADLAPRDVNFELFCTNLIARRSQEFDRLHDVAPSTFDEEFGDVTIEAVPDPALGPEAAPLFLARALGEDDIDDQPILGMKYFNPFPNATALVRMESLLSRIARPEGSSKEIGLRYGTEIYAQPLAGRVNCESEPTTFEGKQVGLIDAINLGDKLLVDDTADLEIGASVDVTWTTTSEPLDHFRVRLLSVEIQSDGLPFIKIVTTRLTTKPRTTLPASVFVPGLQHFLVVDGIRGRPDARDGDYVTVEYPYATSTAMSSLFRVH